MNQTSELRYRPPHMWSTSIWQEHNTISSINYAAGKKHDFHMQKNETGPQSYATHKIKSK